MKLQQPTGGAAVILVVLLTLLLLAGILSASLRLSLSSRQNTADQTASLGAQYAAESQVALAESRFRDIQRLLTNKVQTPAGYEVRPLELAPTTTVPDMEMYARQFCGKVTAADPWRPTSAFSEARNGAFPEAQECVVDAASRPSDEQFSILSASVTQDAYHLLPVGERPRPGTNLNEWWSGALSLSSDALSYQIVPLRVVKLTPLRYRFYLGVKELQAKGIQGRAERVIRGQRSVDGDWWLEFYMPTPLDYNIFLQSMPPANGGLAYSVIDGDMYVAEHVRFLTAVNNVKFLGNLDTSGCTPLPPANAAPDADCQRTPGFYDSYSPTLNNIAPDGLDSIALNRNLTERVLRTGATLAPGKHATFDAHYIGLPQGLTQQASLAQAGGIVLAQDETHIELLAGDAAGKPLDSYDPERHAWKEAPQTYQYIRLSKPGKRYDTGRWIEYSTDPSVYNQTPPEYRESYGCTLASTGSYVFTCYRVRPSVTENMVTREYRYGPDKVLYGKDAAGQWQAALPHFNGVVYSSGTPIIRGPERLGGDATGAIDKMPPAIASFANLGIVSAEGMRLDTDLTVSDTPCENGRQPGSTSAAPLPCLKTGERTPQNMLGLYTPSGDIVMTTKTPNEATYHAIIMASNGSFQVEQSRERAAQGHRHVIGSVISKFFGLNGVADLTGRGVTAGYSDAFSYDTRLRSGMRPNGILLTEIWLPADNANNGKRLSDVSWRQSRARSQ